VKAPVWSTYQQLKNEHGYNAEEMPPPKVPIPEKVPAWDPKWIEIYGAKVPDRDDNPRAPNPGPSAADLTRKLRF